jgi:hypothetical protein
MLIASEAMHLSRYGIASANDSLVIRYRADVAGDVVGSAYDDQQVPT